MLLELQLRAPQVAVSAIMETWSVPADPSLERHESDALSSLSLQTVTRQNHARGCAGPVGTFVGLSMIEYTDIRRPI